MRERTFQAEKAANAKALGWERVWHVWRIARKPLWLRWSRWGTKLGASAYILSAQDALQVSIEENNYTKQLVVYRKIRQHSRLDQIKCGSDWWIWEPSKLLIMNNTGVKVNEERRTRIICKNVHGAHMLPHKARNWQLEAPLAWDVKPGSPPASGRPCCLSPDVSSIFYLSTWICSRWSWGVGRLQGMTAFVIAAHWPRRGNNPAYNLQ